jgi:hypothetical protein
VTYTWLLVALMSNRSTISAFIGGQNTFGFDNTKLLELIANYFATFNIEQFYFASQRVFLLTSMYADFVLSPANGREAIRGIKPLMIAI